ncbi:MAG: class I SAM-dependent RNA methyltransferase [Boseongicola sp.]
MPMLTIDRLGHRGDGIAEGPIYVPRTLPGEIVEGEIVDGCVSNPRIMTPSPIRVSPPCRHYASCGGCALQHASDEFVASWKRRVVEAALSAHGLAAPIRRIHVSPPFSRRRATFTGKRTKKGAMVGLHAPESALICAIPDCRILRPALLNSVPTLEKLCRLGATRKGEMRFVVTETDTGLDVAATQGKPLDLTLRQTVADIAAAAGLGRVSWNDEPIVQRTAQFLTFGTAPVPVPPGAFLQATVEGETALLASVRDGVGEAKSVADLFAGCGTFSLPLAENAEVHAVEGRGDMLRALDAGWRHGTNLRSVTTEARDLFRQPMLADEVQRFDAIVIDPPRAGAEAQTMEIAKAQPPVVASVSCNPTTFARDAAILINADYVLDWIDLVDQFRWSTHIEVAAKFSLK